MQAVAVGWQLYDLTHDPLDLGLVGLMQFFPVVVLALVIGQTADHFDRRAIAGTCQVVKAICAALFALGTSQGWLDRASIFALILSPEPRAPSRRRRCIRSCPASCRARCCRGRLPHPRPRTRRPSSAGRRSADFCMYSARPPFMGLPVGFLLACVLVSFVQGEPRAA